MREAADQLKRGRNSSDVLVKLNPSRAKELMAAGVYDRLSQGTLNNGKVPFEASGKIDKSTFEIVRPKEIRYKDNLKFVAPEPCLVRDRRLRSCASSAAC